MPLKIYLCEHNKFFSSKIWIFDFFVVTLQSEKKGVFMATYALTINERSSQGKALLAYLSTLNIQLRPVRKEIIDAPCQFTADELRDILVQATSEARTETGTTHVDFKSEVAKWL